MSFPLDATQGFNGKRAPTSEEDSKSQRFAVSSGAFDKIVNRPELFELIAKWLKGSEFSNLTQVSKEIYEATTGDVTTSLQRLLTPSNKRALSLEVRGFFDSHPEGENPIFSSEEVEDLTFAEIGYLLNVQRASIKAHFPGFTSQDLGDLFQEAVAQGADGIVAAIIEGPRFGEIEGEVLKVVFRNAAENGHEKGLKALIDCKRFKEISVEDLGEALWDAAYEGHEGCLRALINCTRFGQISVENLESALWDAACIGNEGCLRALINCPRFGEIPREILAELLSTSPEFKKNLYTTSSESSQRNLDSFLGAPKEKYVDILNAL